MHICRLKQSFEQFKSKTTLRIGKVTEPLAFSSTKLIDGLSHIGSGRNIYLLRYVYLKVTKQKRIKIEGKAMMKDERRKRERERERERERMKLKFFLLLVPSRCT
uniref:Bm13475, isoform a n=1 Tax=Brugia malayi TaxID=6279 RepID=A0A1I9G040_BRUMA|nr:Bm13475, isoform a [Brugia malayi]